MGLSGQGILPTGCDLRFHPCHCRSEVKRLTVINDLNAEHLAGYLQRKVYLLGRNQMGMGMTNGIGEAFHKRQLSLHP